MKNRYRFEGAIVAVLLLFGLPLVRDIALIAVFTTGEIESGSFRGVEIGDSRQSVAFLSRNPHSKVKIVGCSNNRSDVIFVARSSSFKEQFGQNCGDFSNFDYYHFWSQTWYEESFTVQFDESDKVIRIEYLRNYFSL